MRRLFIACAALLALCGQSVAHTAGFLELGAPLNVALLEDPVEGEFGRVRITEDRESNHQIWLETAGMRHVDSFSGTSFEEVNVTLNHKFESYTKRGVILSRLSGATITGYGDPKTYLDFADVRMEGRFRRRAFYLSFFSDDWVATEWLTSSVQVNNFGDSAGKTEWVLQREYITYVGLKVNVYNVFLEDDFFGSFEVGSKWVNGDGYGVRGFTVSTYGHFRVYGDFFVMGYADWFVRKYKVVQTQEVISYLDYYAKIGGFMRRGEAEYSLAFFWGETQSVAFLPNNGYKLGLKKKGMMVGYGLRFR